MRIVRIFAHRVELPLVEGSYKWSGGKSVSVFDTDCGRIGYGEVCPLGPFYPAPSDCIDSCWLLAGRLARPTPNYGYRITWFVLKRSNWPRT
jgi:hypothetical protein